MKKIIAFLFVLMISGITNAIIVQRIYLKNGSVLNGFIERQDTCGNYTIRTDNATICLVDARYATKEDTIKGAKFFKDISIERIVKEESQLTEPWKQWAEENNAYKVDGTKRSLTLNEIRIDGKSETILARIIENGSRVKYLEQEEKVYHVAWKDIESIKGDMRAETELSGINRIYTTANGRTFEGQFAEETDNSLGLYVDGTIVNLDVDDVIKYTFKALNNQQDIFEQSPLVETVYYRNGNTRGIIIEQNYSNESNNQNYILVRDETGGISSVKFSDLLEIKREINTKYAPKFDLVLKEGEVQVNRNATRIIKVTDFDNNLHVDSVTTNNIVKINDEQIDVEFRTKDYPDTEAFQLIKINTKVNKKQPYYYMTYKDLASVDSHPLSIEKKPNTIKAVYKTPSKSGIYGLFNSKNMVAIIIKVE